MNGLYNEMDIKSQFSTSNKDIIIILNISSMYPLWFDKNLKMYVTRGRALLPTIQLTWQYQ